MDCKLRCMTSVYLHRNDRFLLLYRIGSGVIDDSYTGTGGGHFDPDDRGSAAACALRELREETGLTEDDISDLTLRYVTIRRKNGEIRQNYYFFADYDTDREDVVSNEGRLEWVNAADMPNLPMPYSAKKMIEHYLSEGRYTNHLYAGISTEAGIDFKVLNEF